MLISGAGEGQGGAGWARGIRREMSERGRQRVMAGLGSLPHPALGVVRSRTHSGDPSLTRAPGPVCPQRPAHGGTVRLAFRTDVHGQLRCSQGGREGREEGATAVRKQVVKRNRARLCTPAQLRPPNRPPGHPTSLGDRLKRAVNPQGRGDGGSGGTRGLFFYDARKVPFFKFIP